MDTTQDKVNMNTNISEVVMPSVGHPMRKGFNFFIIFYVHSCLENMLKNLHGNGGVCILGSLKVFMVGMDNGCFRNAVGTVMMSEERAYEFR